MFLRSFPNPLVWVLPLCLICSCGPGEKAVDEKSGSAGHQNLPVATVESDSDSTLSGVSSIGKKTRVRFDQNRRTVVKSAYREQPVEQSAQSTLLYEILQSSEDFMVFNIISFSYKSDSAQKSTGFDSESNSLVGMPDFVPQVFSNVRKIDFRFERDSEENWKPTEETKDSYDRIFQEAPAQARDYFKSTLGPMLSLNAFQAMLPEHKRSYLDQKPSSWTESYSLPDQIASAVPVETTYSSQGSGVFGFEGELESGRINPAQSIKNAAVHGTVRAAAGDSNTVEWDDEASWEMIVESGFSALQKDPDTKPVASTILMEVRRKSSVLP